jgi:O-antigen ligase
MIKTATFAAHNEYLRLTVETGYVGITIIMGLLLALFAYIFITRKNCQNPVYLTIVASFFVYSYTDNVISSNTSIFVLFMACSMSIAPQYRKSIARASNVNKNEFYPKSEYSTFGEKSATS